jgi:ribosomal protein S18 acetylase RimI-like enzyme
MEDKINILIRDFKPHDLSQVANILASSFLEMYNKIVKLQEVELANFIIETGEVPPDSYPGYIVAEENGEIQGLVILSWFKQEKPKLVTKISKIFHYGWITAMKLLIMRYLFPEKPKRGACHVSLIAVLKKARGKGIAAKLLEQGRIIALANGLNKYTLNVDSTNKVAYRLYQKMGFEIEKKYHNLIARWVLDEKEWYFMSKKLDTLT